MIQRFALLLVLGATTIAAQTEGPVISAGPLLHMVSDLDRSIAFYHDQLGFEFAGPAGDHTFQDIPAVANLYGVPGKQFRVAILKIPGSTLNLEMAEWRDARPLDDVGWAALTLFRVDGSPYKPTTRDTTLLRDPDGLRVGVRRTETPAVYLSINTGAVSKSLALYSKTLGFRAEGSRLSVPGDSMQIRLGDILTSDSPAPPPSRAMLRLRVRDIDSLTASLKAAGFTVITTGGAPVTLPGGARAIIVRDPNGFYWQPMEVPQK